MKCFVIMPFSTTKSCTEFEWTMVFEEVIKPAVEACGIICYRSSATLGNIIKDIISDLDSADIVIADLTDQNANVMYELGVRHSLASKTIIISQNREHIPFDLRGYANHEYRWKTSSDKQEFSATIKGLIDDITSKPNRSDNPVHDFLDSTGKSGVRLFPAVREAPQFSELVDKANSEVFAIGPNLGYVAQNLRTLIFNKASLGVRFRLLVMDLVKEPCNLIKDYASTALFKDELQVCHNTFKEWLIQAKDVGLNIECRIAPLVPLSVNMIDCDSAQGCALIIPVPYKTPGAERPCILVERKKNSKVFDTYYKQFENFWKNSKPLA